MAASLYALSTPIVPPSAEPNKRYFVSFSYKKGSESGFSWVVYGAYNVLSLSSATNYIKSYGWYDEVIIIFFKELTEDEY